MVVLARMSRDADATNDATRILKEGTGSDGRVRAQDRLLPVVYNELRRLAAYYLQREKPGQTLQATALVNEAYLKLVDQTQVAWQGRTHFFAVCAQAMRRILVDQARAKLRDKRGGGMVKVTFVDDLMGDGAGQRALEDIVALDEALTKLAEVDPRQAKLVEQRFFGGLTVEEAAFELGISKRTAEGEWTHAKAWLGRALSETRAE